jgi:DNA-binding SARP family transcriptional activator
MRYRILGRLAVWDGQGWAELRPGKWRSILAFLLIHANCFVSTETLVAELWGEQTPSSAVKSLQVYIHRLRRALGASSSCLMTRPGGYELAVAPGDLDAERFGALVAAGRALLAVGRPRAAVEQLTQAQALWHGRALANVAPSPAVLAEESRLAEWRLSAWEDLAAAKLAAGRHAELVPELGALVVEQPMREPLWGALMIALYRSGRRSDALEAYSRARRALIDELGTGPGSELRRIYRAVLADDGATTETQRRLPEARPPDRTAALRTRAFGAATGAPAPPGGYPGCFSQAVLRSDYRLTRHLGPCAFCPSWTGSQPCDP